MRDLTTSELQEIATTYNLGTLYGSYDNMVDQLTLKLGVPTYVIKRKIRVGAVDTSKEGLREMLTNKMNTQSKSVQVMYAIHIIKPLPTELKQFVEMLLVLSPGEIAHIIVNSVNTDDILKLA